MPYAVRNKVRYWIANSQCLGMACFQPGSYQHRGATSSGSRNTGSDTLECMTNAYRGCPADREHDKKRETERKRDGWKVKH